MAEEFTIAPLPTSEERVCIWPVFVVRVLKGEEGAPPTASYCWRFHRAHVIWNGADWVCTADHLPPFKEPHDAIRAGRRPSKQFGYLPSKLRLDPWYAQETWVFRHAAGSHSATLRAFHARIPARYEGYESAIANPFRRRRT